MPLVIRANYPDSYENGALYDKALLVGYEMVTPIFPTIFNVYGPGQTPAKDRVRMTSVSGVGRPVQVSEGAEIIATDPTQGFDKTIIFDKFAQACKITDEAIADDQLGLVTRAAREIGITFREWQEDRCARLLRLGFVSTTYAGGDGLALFSTAHTYPGSITAPDGSTTQSNSGTQPLSASSLDEAVKAMDETINAAGAPSGFAPRYLVVPPALRILSRKLLGSELMPQSSLNDINVMNSLGIIPISLPHLSARAGGSDTAWYLLAEPSRHDLSYWQRDLPTTEVVREGTKQSEQYQVTHRAGFGFNDWRGTWGSTGTGA